MHKPKIGIVEDEIIIADSIRSVLMNMEYIVPEPCSDYKEAITMLHLERPDLAILDINLAGSEHDGIAVAKYIRENFDMPFIFLTANSDPGTVARSKSVNPNAFLVKPFQREDLYTAIEIAIHNFYSVRSSIPGIAARQYLFIKQGTQFHKVNYEDILYMESDHVYVCVYTAHRKFLVRTSLQQYLEELDETVFIRVHRGYIVNRNKIDNISSSQVIVGNKIIPVSKKYRDNLFKQL